MKNKKAYYLLIVFVVLIAHTLFLSFWLSSELVEPARVRVEEITKPNAQMILPSSALKADSITNKHQFNFLNFKEVR
jgi:hypothetical protein